MRVALCTNIRPIRDEIGLPGRNQAIIDRLSEDGHAVDVLYGPERLLHGDAPSYDVGLLAPNDLLAPRPDPVGRLAAETAALGLEAAGVPFVNSPLTRRHAANKLLAHIAFRSAGLRQPATWTFAELDDLHWPEAGLLVKPITGSCGFGISVAHSPGDARALIAASGEPSFVQEIVHPARCIRVIATREHSVGRYEKRMPPGTLFAAITSGAQEVKLDPRADLDDLGVAMVRAVGLDIVGVDILESTGGALFALEANVNFGFYSRNREILDALADQVELRGAGRSSSHAGAMASTSRRSTGSSRSRSASAR
jgi:glutathione synthase/RimK-type ligase-like ATP-grasp enzyme